jgi:DNA repair protein RecN (Recombination protein N)
MLKKLHIQNYAIIDEIEIDFSAKLNIITGETGAGKSILMGALSLILGERADTSVLRNSQKKCFIEGVFIVKQKALVQTFLNDNELDADDELVLRREIAANGKSRAFINDTPATLQQIKQLASLLVDLHRQFDTLELGDTNFQRDVLDALANQVAAVQSYHVIYRQWQQAKKALQQLQQQKTDFDKESGYNQFLFDELYQLGLKENELEDAETELKLLSNAEGIKNTLEKVYADLKDTELPLVQHVKQLSNQLQTYSDYHTSIPSLVERLKSVQIELQDIADETEQINQSVHFDQQRIDEINEKISQGYKLLKKHGVQTTNQLLTIQAELEEKLQAVLQIDETIVAQQQLVDALMQQAATMADSISAARQQQIPPLEEQVNTLLVQVGMPNARLKVSLQKVELDSFGCDSIEFLFDANKSNKFEPIRKVASGGELSRLMLCIKSLVAQSVDLPTLIFDEIDTGISGEAAKQVGIIMKQLAKNLQVIAITHQPQIAGRADAHLFVYKEIVNDTVKTNVRLLNQDERITTIAQMLSGEKPTAAALASAKEMMN